MDYYINNKIISNNLILFHNGVRDNSNINVMKCLETNALILDKNIQTKYFDKGINYWNELSKYYILSTQKLYLVNFQIFFLIDFYLLY